MLFIINISKEELTGKQERWTLNAQEL